MGEAVREEGKRTIKLFCPSVSKSVQIIEGVDQRLDLGFISRAFGLDPNTLKLNGHFISRGVDFIASSVTWKSLIGFFSARGLSTGGTDSDALLVHGKPSPTRPVDLSIQTAWCNGPDASRLKRKLWLEDDSHLKRSRTYEAFPKVCYGRLLAGNGTTTSNRRSSPCSFFSKNTKRIREEENVATTPLKKIR
ncbi:uncharacterized protein [Primulina huaijiensis]|uniref:uncharacterized protein isoform X2 n=1 Tax=Primulina huaijiensis TaxID=1492673 RepID=UPI003CC7868F